MTSAKTRLNIGKYEFTILLLLILAAIKCGPSKTTVWAIRDDGTKVFESPDHKAKVLVSIPLGQQAKVKTKDSQPDCPLNREASRFCAIYYGDVAGWTQPAEFAMTEPKARFLKFAIRSGINGTLKPGSQIYVVSTEEALHAYARQGLKTIRFYYAGNEHSTWEKVLSDKPNDLTHVEGIYQPRSIAEIAGIFEVNHYPDGTPARLELTRDGRFTLIGNYCHEMYPHTGTYTISSSRLILRPSNARLADTAAFTLEFLTQNELVFLNDVGCNPNLGDLFVRIK